MSSHNNVNVELASLMVVLDKGERYDVNIVPGENYHVLVTPPDNINVNILPPNRVVVEGDFFYRIADYATMAGTSSFALTASYVEGLTTSWDTLTNKPAGIVSSSTQVDYTLLQNLPNTIPTASLAVSASYAATASFVLNSAGVEGGTVNYIPLWTGETTLTSSVLYQTGSSILLGSTEHHTPESPDVLGLYAGVTDSYNLLSGHGEIDNYFQINIKNFSTGSFASADIVATADNGDEFSGYIDMGINGSGYSDGFGGPNDGYLYIQGAGDLLIGNKSNTKRIILFVGDGDPINNARVFIDPSGSVNINTDFIDPVAPDALRVLSVNANTYNVITALGFNDGYSQINIKNTNTGQSASSDIVATANNGTESENYIDMGINSNQFNGPIGGPNDAYLYSTGRMLHIGNTTPDEHIMFFVGGDDVHVHNKLTLDANNNHELTGSLTVVSGSIIGSFSGFLHGTAATASYVVPTGLPAGVNSSSAQTLANISGSVIRPSRVRANTLVADGYVELYPTSETITTDPNSAYFYISGSSNDLWYAHKTDSIVNFDWIEGVLETGLLHGGIISFSGSVVYVSSGSGIIVTHGATTSSAPSPTLNYVNWPAITASVDVSSSNVTYLYIDANGALQQQSTKFTSFEYHETIPLGAVGHFNRQSIVAAGGQSNTQYSQFAQLTDFARNFGPIKVSGYGMAGHSGSLGISVDSGQAFIYGAFYKQNPETPSNYTSPAVATASMARIYRSGSGDSFAIDSNNNNFYQIIDPTKYDDGSGVLANVSSSQWTIQRVFIEPVTRGLYVYYGQSVYDSFSTAVSNILSDPFTEGAATTLFTVFAGYIVVKGGTTNLADTSENKFISAALFRNTSAGSTGGAAAAASLNDLSDVEYISPQNGQALVYNNGLWENGTPISSSYSVTSSYAETSSIALKVRIYSGSVGTGGAAYTGSFTGSFEGNGSGLSGVLAALTTGVGPAASSPSTETVIQSYTLPANRLTTGKSLRILALWKHTGGTVGPRVGVKFGNTTIVNLVGIGNTETGVKTEATVAATSLTTQEAYGTNFRSNGALNGSAFTSPTEDLSTPITIQFLANFNTTTTDTVQLVHYSVELVG